MTEAPNVLTVDVEEWFHICGMGGPIAPDCWPQLASRVADNTRLLLDLLDRCGVRATFFVLGWVAERYPSIVQRIAAAGHEVGSHGFSHTRVYELTPEEFRQDLDRSVNAISACGIDRIVGFRAPEWSINDRSLWALDILTERGFTIDSSMAPLRIVGSDRFAQSLHRRRTPSGDIVECPPAVTRRLGQNVPFGGGWGLRRSSPSQVLSELARRNRAGTPAVLWVHPWELDDNPPRVSLPWGLWFAHYFRLSGFRARLETILRGTRFVPLTELVSQLGD